MSLEAGIDGPSTRTQTLTAFTTGGTVRGTGSCRLAAEDRGHDAIVCLESEIPGREADHPAGLRGGPGRQGRNMTQAGPVQLRSDPRLGQAIDGLRQRAIDVMNDVLVEAGLPTLKRIGDCGLNPLAPGSLWRGVRRLRRTAPSRLGQVPAWLSTVPCLIMYRKHDRLAHQSSAGNPDDVGAGHSLADCPLMVRNHVPESTRFRYADCGTLLEA
jgi:hypothetical protein